MDDIVEEIFNGNDRHVETTGDSLADLQAAQHPGVLTVSCGDSRVLQDGMWDNNNPGRIFTHSNIGNRIRQETGTERVVAGDVLYPLVHTGTDVAVVVGHTGCGAVTATYDSLRDDIDEPAGIHHCVEMLEDDLERALDLLPSGLDDGEAINHLVEYNVDRQVEHLNESDAVPNTVTVLGAVYDFHDVYSSRRGAVHLVNVDGVRTEKRLQADHPELADRVSRLWEY